MMNARPSGIRMRMMATASLLVCPGAVAQDQAHLPGSMIPQFIDPLPVLDIAGGSIRTVVAGPEEFELHMREFRANMLPSSFVPPGGAYAGTWVWGYIPGPDEPTSPAPTFTGPVIIATRGVPAQLRFVNDLPTGATTRVRAWAMGVDQTLHWADPLGGGANMCAHELEPGIPPMDHCAARYEGPIPAVVHLHGGDVPPAIDGGPDAWFTSDGAFRGHAYYTRPGVPAAGNQAVYRYPNGQEAAPTWFHDHALGITRLNVYAGLAGAYCIVDPSMELPAGLHPLGLRQGADGPVDALIPLVIQDRMFDVDGQLYFPSTPLNPEHPYWMPEFMGDAICVNGKTWPYLNVEPRRCRFLIINGSNARTYSLSLGGQAVGGAGPTIWQIGTDGGYLDAPAPAAAGLVLMPGERADVIVDFGAFRGQTLLMRNTARTPYPKGEPPMGGTIGRILQFRVGNAAITDLSYDPASGTPIRAPHQRIVRLANATFGALAPGVRVDRVRQLTLNEVMGPGGPLEVLVNNTKWSGSDRPDFVGVTVGGVATFYSELPEEGSTEVWEIVNLTADAHPIHTHLTQCQILNRQNFNARGYERAYSRAFPGGGYIGGYGPPLDYATGNPRALGGNPDVTPYLQGPPRGPAPNEAGWKDTMLMMPGQVTRFVVRFAPQDKALDAPDLHYAFDPAAGGHGYVWHCHIIDHEDNEMMRPFLVVPRPAARTYIMGVDY